MNAASTFPSLQRCASCTSYLDIGVDRQRSTGKYWKNCQRCRDKRNSSNRKKRGLPPVQRDPKRIDHGANYTSQETNSDPAKPPQEAIVPRTPAKSMIAQTEIIPVLEQSMSTTSETSNLTSKAKQPRAEHPRLIAMKAFIANAEREVRRSGATPYTISIINKEARHRVAQEESRLRAEKHARNGTTDPVVRRHRKACRAAPLDVATNALMDTLVTPAHHMATTQLPTARALTYRTPSTQTPTSHVGLDSVSTPECSVCGDRFSLEEFPRLGACSHEPRVCQECFLGWLNQRMASTTWEQIQCPSSGCTNVMSHDDVKKYAPAETFIRFDELSMRGFLSNDPSFFYCPAQGCSSGQIHDTTYAGNIFRCNACGFRVCTHHEPHVPFHENQTCAQFDERITRERAEKEEEERKRREDEAASVTEVANSSVECPGCGAHITKTAGCDHMTCRRPGCNFQFCYVCRAPYTGAEGIYRVGNTAHATGCPYSSIRLPAHPGAMLGLV